jgi:four helix bundle protein
MDDRWKKLDVWKMSDELALKVYCSTRQFPNDEKFGITSQLRRAALSVPTNIVEGYARKGDRELARFVNISLGSLAETKYLLSFSNRLKYLNDKEYKDLEKECNIIGKMLWRFYEAVKK